MKYNIEHAKTFSCCQSALGYLRHTYNLPEPDLNLMETHTRSCDETTGEGVWGNEEINSAHDVLMKAASVKNVEGARAHIILCLRELETTYKRDPRCGSRCREHSNPSYRLCSRCREHSHPTIDYAHGAVNTLIPTIDYAHGAVNVLIP